MRFGVQQAALVATNEALTSSVLHDLVPVDLGAGDGELTAEGLEGGGTHGAVRVLEGVLEVSLNRVDGLEGSLSEGSGISDGDRLGLFGVSDELDVSFFVVVDLDLKVTLQGALARSGLELDGPGGTPASSPVVLLVEQVGGNASGDDDIATSLGRVGGLGAVHVVIGGVSLRRLLKLLTTVHAIEIPQ